MYRDQTLESLYHKDGGLSKWHSSIESLVAHLRVQGKRDATRSRYLWQWRRPGCPWLWRRPGGSLQRQPYFFCKAIWSAALLRCPRRVPVMEVATDQRGYRLNRVSSRQQSSPRLKLRACRGGVSRTAVEGGALSDWPAHLDGATPGAGRSSPQRSGIFH